MTDTQQEALADKYVADFEAGLFPTFQDLLVIRRLSPERQARVNAAGERAASKADPSRKSLHSKE